MSTPDLRADFEALRDRDRAAAPSFDALVARRPERRTSPLLYIVPAAAALSVVAVAAAFVVWMGAGMRAAEPPRDHTARASDPEPLGFLLDSPPVLARVPDFDSSPIKERRR